jgi:hypothetical protein
MRGQPEYPGEFVARPVTNAPPPGIQAQLPTDLVRSGCRA